MKIALKNLTNKQIFSPGNLMEIPFKINYKAPPVIKFALALLPAASSLSLFSVLGNDAMRDF